MAARKSTTSSRSRNPRSARRRLSSIVRNPARAQQDVMNAATMGMERVGRTLEMVADFAQRAGRALNDVGESLLRAAKDVQPSARGRSASNGTKGSTNGRTTARGARLSRRGSTSVRRDERTTSSQTADESAPFTGVGA